MASSKGGPDSWKKLRTRPRGASASTLVERIAEELRERIIDGTLTPGEHLQQALLARRMGVSSIPLREAIRALELEGFVEILPFKGARVRRLTLEEIRERVEIACMLECHAIEITLPTLTDRDLDLAAEMAQGLFPTPDVRTWFERVNRLLYVICGGARMPVMYQLIVRNRTAARRYTELLIRKTMVDKEWEETWAASHFRRVVALMREKDLEGIRAIERARFDGYLQYLSPWLQAEVRPDDPGTEGVRRSTRTAARKPRRTAGKREVVRLRGARGAAVKVKKRAHKAPKKG